MYVLKLTPSQVCILAPGESSSSHCGSGTGLTGHDQKKRLYISWHSNKLAVSQTATATGDVTLLASRSGVTASFSGIAIKMDWTPVEAKYKECGQITPSEFIHTHTHTHTHIYIYIVL